MRILLIPIAIVISILLIAGVIVSLTDPDTQTRNTRQRNTNNPGAIIKSTDAGITFESKSFTANTSNGLQQDVQDIIFVKDQTLLTFTPKTGVFKSLNWGEEWNNILTGDIITTALEVNKDNPDEMYVGVVNNRKARIYRTTDEDINWKEVYTEARSGTQFVSLQVSSNNRNSVYGLLSNGVLLKSYDKGNQWILAEDLNVAVIDMVVVNDNLIYILAEAGVYVSTDGGFSFNIKQPRITARPVTGSSLYSIAVNQKNSDQLYVSATGQLFRSNNRGDTWEEIRILTPDLSLPIQTVEISTLDDAVVYYSVGSTLYRTSNRGESWTTLDVSQYTQTIQSILVDSEKNDILYLGTK